MLQRFRFAPLVLLASASTFVAACSGSASVLDVPGDASSDAPAACSGNCPSEPDVTSHPAEDAGTDATSPDGDVDAYTAPDTSAPDTGAPDAGDAGIDSGEHDAGHDAQVIDSGPDAAPQDAGDASIGADASDAGTLGADAGEVPDADAVPPSPSGPGTTATTAQAFALHHIHLGDESDATGKPDWYKYGYNLDGKVTTALSTDVCALAPSANKRNQVDGPGGIDNSFGENIVGLISAVTANPSQSTDTAIAAGKMTTIVDVVGLTASTSQTNTGLSGGLFVAVPFNQAPNAHTAVPTFTTSDDWPVDPAWVASPIAASGQLGQPVKSIDPFQGAYVAGGEFVSGTSGTFSLVLPISGVNLSVPIQRALVTFQHDAAGHASGGVIAGVIKTQDFVAALQAVAGSISTAFCSGSAFAQVATAIEQSSDILSDGTNVAGVPCDAISIGIGFDADEIGQPQWAGKPAPQPNPCADAGVDGG